MASLPPKIDQRTYEEIVGQTKKLAKELSGWEPASDGKKDAGEALIRIFARMVKLVSDRLNQVPEKNFLAFLDLIGGELKPPQPAKVPLTFYLAKGSSEDALVPAHTQVSAPPTEESDEEIVFETDRELVVTSAQLKAVYVREPSRDMYSDRTLEATGQKDEAFLAFEGDRTIEHSLYVICPKIFALPQLENLSLIITGDINQVQSLHEKLNWSHWDASQWNQLNERPTYNNDKFTFTKLPILNDSKIKGKTAKGLRAKLTNIDSNISANLPQISGIIGSINIKQANLIPEVCLFNNTPLDLSKDFYLFGEKPQLNDTFYIALDNTFIKPKVIVTIDITLSHTPENTSDLPITWEVGNGQVWQKIASEGKELMWIESTSAIQFTKSDDQGNIQAKLQFPAQANMPHPSTVNGETRYWIRARITQGHYGKPSKKSTFYDEVALVDNINSNNITVAGNAEDLFSPNDVIRLLWIDTKGNREIKEDHVIEKIENSTISIKGSFTNETIPENTQILRRELIEQFPKTYDPPLVKSLKLAYDFDLTENAIYCANNDFNYYKLKGFTTQLKKEAKEGDKLLSLGSVKGLTVGEFITINKDNYQIQKINPKTNQVILTSKVSQRYGKLTDVNRHFRPFTPTIDREPTLYLGFDQSFDNKTVTLYARVEPPLPDELSQDNSVISQKPKLIWEYSSDSGWQTLGVTDETQAFSQRGLIQFIAPVDFSKSENFGKQLYWLRVRWQEGNFRVKPRLRRILTNTMWATQAITLKEEVLGSSTGDPKQVFLANNTPILLGQKLEVEEGQIPPEIETDHYTVIRDELENIESVWVQWEEVQDFYVSGQGDRHYILDRQTGEITFGDGIAGMIPPRRQNNIRLSSYRTGGGKQGNVNTETIDQLKTSIPYIDRVINHEAAAGGAEQEDLERLKERVPKQLRHRDRAVTWQDMKDLAHEASTDVARVKVVTPDMMSNFNPLFTLGGDWDVSKLNSDQVQELKRKCDRAGQVKLIILPHSSDRQPVPSIALLKEVESYIRARCSPTIDLVVTAPKWRKVTVTTTIVPTSLENLDLLKENVRKKLEYFLHPLTGGRGQKGWQFGRHPHSSDFYALIQSIPGVDWVDSLQGILLVLNKETKKLEPKQIDNSTDKADAFLEADALIYSGNHVVNLAGN